MYSSPTKHGSYFLIYLTRNLNQFYEKNFLPFWEKRGKSDGGLSEGYMPLPRGKYWHHIKHMGPTYIMNPTQ